MARFAAGEVSVEAVRHAALMRAAKIGLSGVGAFLYVMGQVLMFFVRLVFSRR